MIQLKSATLRTVDQEDGFPFSVPAVRSLGSLDLVRAFPQSPEQYLRHLWPSDRDPAV